MTDKIAIGLASIIITFIGIDALVFDWSATGALVLKFADLVEWTAFWR